MKNLTNDRIMHFANFLQNEAGNERIRFLLVYDDI